MFPTVPRANTNLPTVMCAEKISDAILNDAKPGVRSVDVSVYSK
ncbi:hypothetical protein [Caballeronia sp. 15711]